MRLQQNTIIIHDKLFIIAILFGEENVTVSKSWRQNIFTYLFIFLSQKGNSVHEKFIEASILRFHQKEIDAPFSRENDVCIR